MFCIVVMNLFYILLILPHFSFFNMLSLEEEDTTAIGAMVTGVTETGALEVEIGALVAADTGAVATPQAATEKIGKRLDATVETL